jgi:hypothetical protein
MKRIFVCSPYRDADPDQVETNREIARGICRYALACGFAPFAPHLLYTQFTDEADLRERERGIAAGLDFLHGCEELWVWQDPTDGMAMRLTEGMEREVSRAMDMGIPVYPIFLFTGDSAPMYFVERNFKPGGPSDWSWGYRRAN